MKILRCLDVRAGGLFSGQRCDPPPEGRTGSCRRQAWNAVTWESGDRRMLYATSSTQGRQGLRSGGVGVLNRASDPHV